MVWRKAGVDDGARRSRTFAIHIWLIMFSVASFIPSVISWANRFLLCRIIEVSTSLMSIVKMVAWPYSAISIQD